MDRPETSDDEDPRLTLLPGGGQDTPTDDEPLPRVLIHLSIQTAPRSPFTKPRARR